MKQSEAIALRLLNGMLSRLVKTGSLVVIDADGARHVHGDGERPRAVMRLPDPAWYAQILANPELKAGEAYMDGAMEFEEGGIRDLLEIFHINNRHLRGQPVRKLLGQGVQKMRRLHQANPIGRAKDNVAHHYDLSNDFYRLFLDEGMNYSCAYFEQENQTLEDAQRAKLRHVAAKLKIEPGMRILDIGCGWGGMAMYLAEHFDVDVVGVTLSEEQHVLAVERAKKSGLKNRIDIRLADYREVHERFDRIVSIGMFEHVGINHFDEFFSKVSELLADDGAALLHAIGRKAGPGVTGAWIRKYIFPGGYSPAVSETSAAIERSGLWITDMEILRLHYAHTLAAWAARFDRNRDAAREMFDERFCRMWEFYLATSEFAFRHGGHMVFQIQMTKTVDALPIRRDYFFEDERALTARDGSSPTVMRLASSSDSDKASAPK